MSRKAWLYQLAFSAQLGLDQDDNMEILVRIVVVGPSREKFLLDEILSRPGAHRPDLAPNPEEMGPATFVRDGAGADRGRRPGASGA